MADGHQLLLAKFICIASHVETLGEKLTIQEKKKMEVATQRYNGEVSSRHFSLAHVVLESGGHTTAS